MPSATTTEEEIARASADVQRAMLQDMDDSTILAECERRGWTIYWDRPSGRMRIGSVPPGYPPRAEEDADALPFEVGRDE